MKKLSRNAFLAGAVAIALTLVAVTPAHAATRTGSRTCSGIKEVAVTSQVQGATASHAYSNGQVWSWNLTNPDVAFVKTTYSIARSASYTITASYQIYAYNSFCD